MMKKIIVTIFFICCNASAEQIVSFYLNGSWKKVDDAFVKEKFNSYKQDIKYISVDAFESTKSDVYALITGELFLNLEHKDVCSSKMELRLFSKDFNSLSVNGFLVGKRFYMLKSGGRCTQTQKEAEVFSIGYLSDHEFYGIFHDFNKTKRQIKALDESCNIDQILFFERNRNGQLSAMSTNKNKQRFSIIFKEEKLSINPKECFQILD